MKNSRLIVSLAGALVLYAVMQGAISAGLLTVYWQVILIYACVFITYALGLNVIYGYNGQFSLGHAAFYGLGAYSAALVTKLAFGGDPNSFPLGLLVGGAVAGVIGLLVGLPILRLRSDYLGIATLGFGIMVTVLFNNADALLSWGGIGKAMGAARGMTGIPRFTNFAWAFFVAVGAVLIVRNLIYSSHGRAVISVREDEIAADAMGINTTKYKTLAFVVGCALAGVAGGLYAHLYQFMHPSSADFLKSIDVLMVVVLGGLGSMTGTIVASLGWVLLLEGLRSVLPPDFLDWRMVIYPLVLIVVMIVRPRGLMGGVELAPLKPPAVFRRKRVDSGPVKNLQPQSGPADGGPH
jgi:branched-chain amino acid transport system permease protein